MEVKIGIQSVGREIVIETDSPPEDIENSLSDALSDGSLFTVTDDKGGKVLVPGNKIGYVEFSGVEQRRVGFGGL